MIDVILLAGLSILLGWEFRKYRTDEQNGWEAVWMVVYAALVCSLGTFMAIELELG